MQRHLFDHVRVPARQRHILNGLAHDAAAECARYERAIERAGGIDLQILGVGTNGHIGFNEPARGLSARTHRASLTGASRRANRALFNDNIRKVPHEALSMGVATILGARRIVVIATGKTKAAVVRRMLEGPVTTLVPASLLQLHRQVEVWLDRAAASRLTAIERRHGGSRNRNNRGMRSDARVRVHAVSASSGRCPPRRPPPPARRPGCGASRR